MLWLALSLSVFSAQIQVSETVLGTLPGPLIGNLAVSPDHRHVVYAVRLSPGAAKTGDWAAYDDGKFIGRYDGRMPVIRKPEYAPPGLEVQFSQDGKHYAFLGERGGEQIAVVDGVEGPAFDSIREFHLSPSGLGWAYEEVDHGSHHLVQNGRVGPACPGVGWIEFSPDGRHLAHTISTGTVDQVFLDGRPAEDRWAEGDAQRGYRFTQRLSFTPDSRHLFWSQVTKDGNQLLEDGKLIGSVFDIMSCQFSPDSKRIMAVFHENGKYQTASYADGKWTRTGDPLDWTNMYAWSADGLHFYIPVGRAGQTHLVIDGVETPGYAVAYAPSTFLDDGRLPYCTADNPDGSQWTTRIGDEVYPGKRLLAITPDGKHKAFSNGGPEATSIWIDDRKFDGFGGEGLSAQFSGPKGLHCICGKYRESFAIDGVLQPGLGTVSFSPDEKHMAILWLDSKKYEPHRVTVDGHEIFGPDSQSPSVFFDGDSAFHGFGVEEGKLVRVDGKFGGS